jgi:hypothetical protein
MLAREATAAPSTSAAGVPRLQRACKCGAASTGACQDCQDKRLQPRLAIGPADDPYEREADRVADAVLRAPAGSGAVAGTVSPLVQRSGESGAGQAAPRAVHQVIARTGQPLDAATRARLEPRFGHDFSRVRVHHDAAAAASAQAIRAHAYTVGEHVVFGAGRYAPHDAAGQRLLAHELTHVLQQQAGVVRRDSISTPVTGALRGTDDDLDHPLGDEPATPVQRLQRAPAIVGLDESGPGADIGGEKEKARLERIGECLKTKGPDPGECDPATPLSWGDFAPMDPASPFGAVTGWEIRKKDVPSQQCVDQALGRPTGPMRIFQGAFVASRSWTRPHNRDAADPAKNGSAALAAKCRADLDAAGAKGLKGATWALKTTPDATCPASPRASGTPAASRADCGTVIVADFTAQRVAESARLLRHEQNHLDLACAMARKANAMLWRGTDFTALDAVLDKKVKDAQKRYDDESQHGCDATNQAKWVKAVADGLPAEQLLP